MGLFKRLWGQPDRPSPPAPARPDVPTSAPQQVALLAGRQSLEVVGESFYQDALWTVVGEDRGVNVRTPVSSRLLAESDNEYDANAISIWIDEQKVGHLCRDDAAAYRPGLLNLERHHGRAIGLSGTVIGGGLSPRGGYKSLGVWLDHDPTMFGVEPTLTVPSGEMRTGLTEAMASDLEDDSYDLSWWHDLPDDQLDAINMLQDLLVEDPDPIDRHYMFTELEWRLYRHRDEMMNEYDAASVRHDSEMDGIRAAMMSKWDKVPIFDTYLQATIRWCKARDFERALWWAERGLAIYGKDCARQEAVDDLRNRETACRAKLPPVV